MAAISKTVATLRFFGDDLNPDEVTALLGGEPTKSATKGDVIRSEHTGRERIHKTGAWRLEAMDREPGDLDAQIEEILSPLTKDMSVWEGLGRFQPNLFVGLFMKESNEGMELSAKSLSSLGDRGIILGLDIYDPTPDMHNIQIIDGAANATFSVFQATFEEFRLIFPAIGQDMEIVEDFIKRVGSDRAGEVLGPMWERPILKRDAVGIHGTLYFDYEAKREYIPASKCEKDTDALSINAAQRKLFSETTW